MTECYGMRGADTFYVLIMITAKSLLLGSCFVHSMAVSTAAMEALNFAGLVLFRVRPFVGLRRQVRQLKGGLWPKGDFLLRKSVTSLTFDVCEPEVSNWLDLAKMTFENLNGGFGSLDGGTVLFENPLL